jgi:AraC family transcriptional regulator, regulatory protein of adaptative response / methylated-DNA-[protein]-cysteine methyltransferase
MQSKNSLTLLSKDYFRIDQAILFLEQNFREQPSLKEIADHVHLSEYHFQRLFKRWAGISPKQFLKLLTIEYAKKLLEESRSLLEVTYKSGLSSLGRLHDLFVTVDAITPGEFKNKGEGLEIIYGIHPSPFGDCLLSVTERGICGLSFIAQGGDCEEVIKDLKSEWFGAKFSENSSITQMYVDQIFVSSNKKDKPKLNLYLKGTNLQIQVWKALLSISSEFVLSYTDIANLIGKPYAVHEVGKAMMANPIGYIIPCHRIIYKIGIIGNYRWGSARKRAMLGWEAAQKTRSCEKVKSINSGLNLPIIGNIEHFDMDKSNKKFLKIWDEED